MKIKLDENIPVGLKGILGDLGHEVDTVPDEGLEGRIDPDIWTAAQAAGAFLITQDLDF
jgi:predicted nuclease of predicted toxin-antitoxin system